MKGIIVYSSKYGATAQYAGFLRNALHIPAYPCEQVKRDTIGSADYIIMGTPVYIGNFRIKKWLKKNIRLLQRRKLFLFVVSGTPPEEKEKLDQLIQKNILKEIIDQVEIFYLHGRMNVSNLHFMDRVMLKMGARMNPDHKEGKRMLTDFDDVREGHCTPIIESVNRFLKNTPVHSYAPNTEKDRIPT